MGGFSVSYLYFVIFYGYYSNIKPVDIQSPNKMWISNR